MSTFEEKFRNLNFNDSSSFEKKFSELDKLKELEKFTKRRHNSADEQNSFDEDKSATQAIFKELIKNVSKSTQQDKMFVLFLIAMLKNKKASNELILALLYIFL